jgi:hypothetical protein
MPARTCELQVMSWAGGHAAAEDEDHQVQWRPNQPEQDHLKRRRTDI